MIIKTIEFPFDDKDDDGKNQEIFIKNFILKGLFLKIIRNIKIFLIMVN